ncbi:HAD family hydrolase [Caldimonas thermodepolymerans]|jgi:HAD superfamily hydrolase (TIGR01490 family)|uniref:HAD superfamily hydrolase (TIGR01490 family) n=1 Tax=Caldimonas thermodepolymerans TaxID=215580 RepID=A0A2S5T377_9BURK|nr:HAD family hydrolase [Caldimonas thermodepolymerans]PPE69379.1 HAD-IB family hydrolase [Caldimonas thermodepolymerans]QPC32729.1 HAD family hydrolase [Caldimonas thermodepolymerans]RDI03490.1 HAD superfamily hydrolase (TIGR01490 family) [Caldimonas thermodepolymerans]TCP06651.1 HAD superfamily hydrolase (TIGR01490 family) [Caldimonas thermodepolymerans]UZG45537.1 HAD-IB family hydrolase [Caldimonas thermodepolymerans]
MSGDAVRNLCLFDLDHTLLPIDSDHAFGDFLVRIGWADAQEFRRGNDHYYAQYQAGRLDLDEYIDFTTRPWRTRSPQEQAWVQQRFVEEVVHPNLKPAALDLVRSHQSQGDLVAIVTATNEFVTAPIAAAFGVEHLLAVQLERDAEGAVTGRIRGVPSYQAGKVTRVDQWLASLGLRWEDFGRTSFYSDSPNDLPLLERASDPVATNPSPALEQTAVARGWRILKLFP